MDDDNEKYSKMVHGMDKVFSPACDFEKTPVLPSPAGLEPMYPDDANCAVFVVRSYFPMQPLPSQLRLPITMTVYRDAAGDVTLFNAFRAPAEVEEAVLQLGPVRNVVKLGQFHGAADAYYLRTPRFKSPRYWAAPGATVADGVEAPLLLTVDSLPIADSVLYTLPGLPFVESVMTVPVVGRGRLLVACDALIHLYTTAGVPLIGRALMNLFGFVCVENAPQPAPFWVKHSVTICGKPVVEKWFDHIDKLEWQDFVCAHGPPILNCSHEKVAEAVARKLAAV